MAIAAGATDLPVAWWKEPTNDQWLAWIVISQTAAPVASV